MKFMMQLPDGSIWPVGESEVRKLLKLDDTAPPSSGIIWEDNFERLRVGRGTRPKDPDTPYDDIFTGWGADQLPDAPNLSQAVYGWHPSVYHISEHGLELRALADKSSRTGYRAGMISMERHLTFLYGRVEVELRISEPYQPGLHDSLWLLAADGSWPPEYDILEVVSSNKHAPKGPVNSLTFNAKTAEKGYLKHHAVPRGFIHDWHVYGFDWRPDGLSWDVDGKQVHTAPNLYNKPMYFVATREMGGSANKDFPNDFQPGTQWPSALTLRRLTITR
jgi:beta-glucanase (GH16 family)